MRRARRRARRKKPAGVLRGEAAYTLAVEDGRLVACHRRLADVALTQAAALDRSSGDNIALLKAAFERGADGAVTGFRVSNGRTRGVLFERF